MNILLTGSSAHLATVLLPLLCDHPDVKQVTGIDIKPGLFQHPKFIFHQLDVRSPSIASLLDNIDIVIHLAFVVLRSKLKRERLNRALVQDINVNGSINVFTLCALKHIKKIIHLSSASVYGAWPDNPTTIPESQARRVIQGFSYAEDKNAVEDWLDSFERDNRNIRVVRLRPHVILGLHAQPFLIRLLKQPFYPRLPKPYPLLQCVWEDDVATAILLCCLNDVNGAFNLAAEPALSFHEMLQVRHRITLPLPLRLAATIQRLAWKFSGALEEPGWLDAMRHSLVTDNAKAQKQLGWKPKLTTIQCIAQLR